MKPGNRLTVAVHYLQLPTVVPHVTKIVITSFLLCPRHLFLMLYTHVCTHTQRKRVRGRDRDRETYSSQKSCALLMFSFYV